MGAQISHHAHGDEEEEKIGIPVKEIGQAQHPKRFRKRERSRKRPWMDGGESESVVGYRDEDADG